MKNIIGKAMMMTTVGAVTLTTMAIQADACGLGSTDFKVTASVLNVRTTPGTGGQVVAKLKQGSIVRPTELKNGWAKIGTNKWVSFNYLEMIDNCTIPENGVSYTEIEPTAYIVNADSLNLRNEPSTNAKVITSFAKGKKVYASKTHGKWLFVTDGHNEGWVNGGYAKKATTENNTTAQKPSATITEEKVNMRELKVINTDSLNIRKGPGTEYEIVGTLKKGQTAMSDVKSGNWYKIDEGQWIHQNYVSVTIWSMNSNSTWDDILDVAPAEEVKNNIKKVSSYDGTLNVRYSAMVSSSVKDVLANGDEVEVISERNGWSYIKYTNKNGRTEFGNVASKYLI